MSLITVQEWEASIRSLVKQFPHAKYNAGDCYACSYVQGTVYNGPDSCGCLIGQGALAVLKGKPEYDSVVNQIKAYEETSGQFGPLRFASMLKIDLSEDMELWMTCIQRYQDAGEEWSEALRRADENPNQ